MFSNLARASTPATPPRPPRGRSGKRSARVQREAAVSPRLDTDPIPVLLVDDSPTFVRAAREVLQGARPAFAVSTVTSGSEALAFLERRPPFETASRPAFVILDFRLPDINAPAVLKVMMGRDDLKSIPVLVLSQTAWPEDETAARDAGARAYHVKPSRVRALRDVVVAFWGEQVRGSDDPFG